MALKSGQTVYSMTGFIQRTDFEVCHSSDILRRLDKVYFLQFSRY
jgi:hypothetical protein